MRNPVCLSRHTLDNSKLKASDEARLRVEDSCVECLMEEASHRRDLHNFGRYAEANSVITAYSYSGQLPARLAIDYSDNGQEWQARAIIKKYRKLFPEDIVVPGALTQIDRPEHTEEPPGFSRGSSLR